MGFFRTGRMWAAEHFGICPDIVVFGKSLTNGLNPLSGIWAREELIRPENWPPGSAHATFAANPLGTAAGVEVMRILEETDYSTRVSDVAAYFLETLRKLKSDHPELGFVNANVDFTLFKDNRPVAKIIPLSRRRQWLPASEIGRELERLGPDTTGLAEELRTTLTETTDDLPW